MRILSRKQKQVVCNNDITIEKTDSGFVFFIAGCYIQQKSKATENDAYLAGISYCMRKK